MFSASKHTGISGLIKLPAEQIGTKKYSIINSKLMEKIDTSTPRLPYVQLWCVKKTPRFQMMLWKAAEKQSPLKVDISH